MKFSHLLSKFISVDENKNDGAHPNFVSYKALKKCLRAAAQKHEAFNADHGAKGEPLGALPLTEDEKEFAAILKSDIETINKYFMEKEEEAVIRLQALNERRASGADAAQMMQEFADFHGEMVLLLHWSLINYAGVAKIMKKRDKILGGHAQRDVLNKILNQPFTSTDSISRLVKEAETAVHSLASDLDVPAAGQHSGASRRGQWDVSVPDDFDRTAAKSAGHSLERKNSGNFIEHSHHENVADAETVIHEESYHTDLLKRTRAALGMLAELQATAHTPSTLLPLADLSEKKENKGITANDISRRKRARRI